MTINNILSYFLKTDHLFHFDIRHISLFGIKKHHNCFLETWLCLWLCCLLSVSLCVWLNWLTEATWNSSTGVSCSYRPVPKPKPGMGMAEDRCHAVQAFLEKLVLAPKLLGSLQSLVTLHQQPWHSIFLTSYLLLGTGCPVCHLALFLASSPQDVL